MEFSNHGDNIYLTQRCELLSNLHYSKDLKVEYNGTSTTDTWEFTEIPTENVREHRSRVPRPRRSRSSPIRSGFSGNSSLERRARSPSVSATRLHVPDPQVLPAPAVLSPHETLFTHQSTSGRTPSAMAYFSSRPPYMPLYIVPLPPHPSATAAQTEKNIYSQIPSKVKTRDKTGRKIVKHLLASILKKIPTNTENVGIDAVDVEIAVTAKEPLVLPRSNRSIATQSLSKYGNTRKLATGEEDECSSSESSEIDGCEWAGSVRALRDSHVRLVLRQLRHLRDIKRLSRSLRRELAHE